MVIPTRSLVSVILETKKAFPFIFHSETFNLVTTISQEFCQVSLFIIKNASWALFDTDIIILYLMLHFTRFGTIWRPDQISTMELLAKKVIKLWTIFAESFIFDVHRVLNTSCGFILSHLSGCWNLHLNSNIKNRGL